MISKEGVKMNTFWDIYYWIDMKVREENYIPSVTEIKKRYNELNYDKKITKKGISFYKEINPKIKLK
jgi:hypothetical protein